MRKCEGFRGGRVRARDALVHRGTAAESEGNGGGARAGEAVGCGQERRGVTNACAEGGRQIMKNGRRGRWLRGKNRPPRHEFSCFSFDFKRNGGSGGAEPPVNRWVSLPHCVYDRQQVRYHRPEVLPVDPCEHPCKKIGVYRLLDDFWRVDDIALGQPRPGDMHGVVPGFIRTIGGDRSL